jgi:dethiobiotin synthetase
MILGTDTNVGKTYVACRILEELVRSGVSAAGYKPVASGATVLEKSDAYLLWQASGRRGTLAQVNPQRFAAPLAPPIAAELESSSVDDQQLLDGVSHWRNRCSMLVIEGAGGLMSPLSWAMSNADFARLLELPIVLVSDNRLGVVNQVLTAMQAARSMGLHVQGVVLNDALEDRDRFTDPSIETNERLLASFLARYSFTGQIIRLKYGARSFSPHVDWKQLASKGKDDS